MIRRKRAIPNRTKRFCTTVLKMQPIFEFLYSYHELPVRMRIGYRYDEQERALRFTENFKFAYMVEWQERSCRWINRWQDIHWRVGEFPLIEDRITHYDIKRYWQDKGIDFPEDSNCLNCFWKAPAQLRKNFDTCPPVMWWSAIQEDLQGNTFKDKMSLSPYLGCRFSSTSLWYRFRLSSRFLYRLILYSLLDLSAACRRVFSRLYIVVPDIPIILVAG